MQVVLAVFVALSTIFNCQAFASRTQYFSGMIQVSSLDGKTSYGPPYPSVSKRILDFESGKITECVFQKGRLFLTEMNRTSDPLIFDAKELDKSFTGKLHFSDESLSSWSYDINMVEPKGNITGALPENGAVIDSTSGNMTIRKIWNSQFLISEIYAAISKVDYSFALKALSLPTTIPEICK